ncbi:MAG: hypothetical protein ACR2NU_16760 [Aeoliella sp.]
MAIRLYCLSAIFMLCFGALSSTPCIAVVQSWTLDPSRSFLTLTGQIDNGDLQLTPQSQGSNVTSYSGTITADRTFNGTTLQTMLAFSGGSVIDADFNSTSPFQPTGPTTQGNEDNYGVQVDPGGGTIFGNVRDLAYDISGGTAIVGQSATLSFDTTAGILNEGTNMGSAFRTLNTLDPAVNQSASPVTLVEGGGYETLTIPVHISSTVDLPLTTGEFALVDYTGQLVGIRGLPGDSSGDGVVNEEDFEDWAQSYGSTTNSAADFNQDGVVGPADYNVWRDRLGAMSASSGGVISAVPEPSSVLLIAGCLSVMLSHVGRGRNR